MFLGVGQPVKAKKATASYREILKIQEKIKDADVISYQDLVRCPRNKLPPHVDKLQLQVSYHYSSATCLKLTS